MLSQNLGLLGGIVGDKMQLNEMGLIASEEWLRTAIVRPNVQLDTFVIMPNHIHAIIILNNAGVSRRVAPAVVAHARGPRSGSIGAT